MNNDSIARAMASVSAGAATAAADPDRPVWHFAPPSRWMNDPNGTIFHDGWYHLFYQHNPYDDRWGSMHWGHARSRDLVQWEHLPIALAPAIAEGEEHCYSGCIAADAQGRLRLLYTSVAFAGGRDFQQWSAQGDADLQRWTRDERRPFIPTGESGEPAFVGDVRDPFVFRHAGRTWLILGAILGDEAVVPLYEALDGDLGRWSYRGILHREPRTTLPFPECPNLLPIGDRWLLLLSPYRPVEWRLGDMVDGVLRVGRTGRLDLHDAFYATNTLTDAAGRTVVLGWVRGFAAGRGWSGCLASPRLIEADERAGLRQRPHPCLDLLRAGEPLTWSGTILDRQHFGEHGDAVELRCRLRLTGGVARLRIGGIELAWDGTALALAGSSYAVAAPDGELDLLLLLDRTVCEIFADGGRTVVTRLVERSNERSAVLSIDGGTATADVSIQRLALRQSG